MGDILDVLKVIAIAFALVALGVLFIATTSFVNNAKKNLNLLTERSVRLLDDTDVLLKDVENKLSKLDGIFDTIDSFNNLLVGIKGVIAKVSVFEKMMNKKK